MQKSFFYSISVEYSIDWNINRISNLKNAIYLYTRENSTNSILILIALQDIHRIYALYTPKWSWIMQMNYSTWVSILCVCCFLEFYSHFLQRMKHKFARKMVERRPNKRRGFQRPKERKKRELEMIYDGWWATSLIHCENIKEFHANWTGWKQYYTRNSINLFFFLAKRWRWIRNFKFSFITFPRAEKS